MAPNLDVLTTSPPPSPSPARLTMKTLQRTISDISYELSKVEDFGNKDINSNSDCHCHHQQQLEVISEAVEDAKCECCGMCEECTPEYVSGVRKKFSGKMVCGLCAEAVKEETEKNGGQRDKALEEHVKACERFNSIGRAYPLLYQADAVREILKKSKCSLNHNNGGFQRAKPLKNPGDNKGIMKIGGRIARSSSCISAIGKEMRSS